MNLRTRTWSLFGVALLALLGLCPPVFAQELDLPGLWNLAAKHSLKLEEARKQIESTERDLAIQKASRLPVLSASAAHNYISEVAQFELPFTIPGRPPLEITAGTHRTTDLAVTLQQPLFTGFRLQNSVRAAAQQMEAQRAAYRATANALFLQVGQLYYSLQRNLLHQKVLEQSVQRANLHLRRARALLDAQQIAPFDTLEVANRVLSLTTQLRGLQHQRRILLARLLRAVNVADLDSLAVVNTDTIHFALQPLSDYQRKAKQLRPELHQLSSLQRASAFGVKAARSAFYPQIVATASYHYARPGVNFFRDEWMTYYTAGVGLRWALWDWHSRERQVEKATIALQQVETKRDELLAAVQEQVTEAYQSLLNARDQIELQKQLVRQEKERYRIVREQFRNAQASSLDLSLSETALTAAELGLQDSLIRWLQTRLQLAFATGQLGSIILQEDQ